MLAATLALGGEDGVRLAGGGRLTGWSGLDVTTLDSAGRQCRSAPIDGDALGDLVAKTTRWREEHGRRPIVTARAGKGVRLGIRTMPTMRPT